MKKSLPQFAVSATLIILMAGCNLPNAASTPTVVKSPGTPGISNLPTITSIAGLTPLSTSTTQAPTNTSAPSLTPSQTNTLPLAITPTLTLTLAPTKTSTPKPGTIAGGISGYPYGSLPALTIVAVGQEPPYNYSYIITGAGKTYFSMSTDYLTPGHWQVVAYDSSGNSGGCTGLVTVVSEQTVTCNINDWVSYFPPKPAGIPNP